MMIETALTASKKLSPSVKAWVSEAGAAMILAESIFSGTAKIFFHFS